VRPAAADEVRLRGASVADNASMATSDGCCDL